MSKDTPTRKKNQLKHPVFQQAARRIYGAPIDISNLQIDFDAICYEYGDPPSIIEATLSNKCKIVIHIGAEGKNHAVILNPSGKAVRNRSEARLLGIPKVSILPQIGPLARDETVLAADYVRGAMDSPLASNHFRNQLLQFAKFIPQFRELAERTWSGLQIRELDAVRSYPGDPISLEVRNEEFVGEVSKMGHGLQMWLQCLWFLVRCDDRWSGFVGQFGGLIKVDSV